MAGNGQFSLIFLYPQATSSYPDPNIAAASNNGFVNAAPAYPGLGSNNMTMSSQFMDMHPAGASIFDNTPDEVPGFGSSFMTKQTDDGTVSRRMPFTPVAPQIAYSAPGQPSASRSSSPSQRSSTSAARVPGPSSKEKVKRGRGRPKLVHESAEAEEAHWQKSRENNTISAAKCRARKKLANARLEGRVRHIEESGYELQQQMDDIRDEMKYLMFGANMIRPAFGEAVTAALERMKRRMNQPTPQEARQHEERQSRNSLLAEREQIQTQAPQIEEMAAFPIPDNGADMDRTHLSIDSAIDLNMPQLPVGAQLEVPFAVEAQFALEGQYTFGVQFPSFALEGQDAFGG